MDCGQCVTRKRGSLIYKIEYKITSLKMPPKTVDSKTLTGKRDNAVLTLKELFEEYEEIYSSEPQLERLESTFKIIEAKYRNIKKQQEFNS